MFTENDPVPTSYGRDILRGIISRQKSGRVEIGEAFPIFWQIGIGEPYPEFSSIFPAILGQKKIEKNQGKSG